jgi:cytochrome P450
MHPFFPAVKRAPYAYYERWRREGPVLWNEELRAWLITGYDEAAFVLAHHETFSSSNSVSDPDSTGANDFPSIINVDEPDHSRLRSLVAKAFAPRQIEEGWSRWIERIVAEQLDGAAGDTLNVVRDLGYPLPVRMIAEIIGVEAEKYAQFKTWADAIVDTAGVPDSDSAAFLDAASQLGSYLNKQIQLRRAQPRDDLISRLVEAEEEGQKLTEVELESFLFLLLVAGTQATTTLIATAVRLLTERRSVMRRVAGDRTFVPNLIEEALRYESPVQAFFRKAVRDVELAGEQVRRGDALCVLYGAANRDSAKFDHSDEFRLDRTPNEHLAFGRGIHYCLGANLARIEATVAINAVLDRYDTLTREPGFRLQWRQTPFYRAMLEYPVRVTRRSAMSSPR